MQLKKNSVMLGCVEGQVVGVQMGGSLGSPRSPGLDSRLAAFGLT